MLDKMRMRVGEYRPRQDRNPGYAEGGRVYSGDPVCNDRPEIIRPCARSACLTHSGESGPSGGRRDPGRVDLRLTTAPCVKP